jgi:flavodoxin/NAD-dependent dihydropyrimidine dehydrogenase PreA subunit
MPKTLIVYFSQGGTTERVARQISQGLQHQGYQADLHNLMSGPPPDIAAYDMLGIGLPVYMFRAPFNVEDYLKRLPKLDGLAFFVFLMYGIHRGTTGNRIRRILRRKRGREIGYTYFKGADFFIGYVQRGILFSPNNPTERELSIATEFGRLMGLCDSPAGFAEAAMDPSPPVAFSLEKLTAGRFWVRQIYSRLFGIDKTKCVSCDICVKQCPQNNITIDENGVPRWGRDCILCFYCEMNCPAEAIHSPIDWPIFAPLIQLNINWAMKSDSIEHIRVQHAQGKTIRVEAEGALPKKSSARPPAAIPEI